MPFFFSLIPATLIAVIGYFVLASSARAEGTVQKVGKVLGIWIFVLALLPLAGGAYVTVTGQCPLGGHMSGYHKSGYHKSGYHKSGYHKSGSHMMMRGHGGYPKGDTMPGAMGDAMPEMMTPKTGE